MPRLRWIPLVLCLLLPAFSGRAVPVLHTVQPGGSGTATAQATTSLTPLTTLLLPSISGTITIESTTQAITDFDLLFSGTGLSVLAAGYGGYDRMQIDSFRLSAGPGFASTITSNVGGSTQMAVTPVAAALVYSFQDSTGTFSAANSVPLNFAAPSMTAVVTEYGATNVVVTGVPVALLSPAQFTLAAPETDNLLIVGQFSLSAAAVPEPSTGILLGLGLAAGVLQTRHRFRQAKGFVRAQPNPPRNPRPFLLSE